MFFLVAYINQWEVLCPKNRNVNYFPVVKVIISHWVTYLQHLHICNGQSSNVMMAVNVVMIYFVLQSFLWEGYHHPPSFPSDSFLCFANDGQSITKSSWFLPLSCGLNWKGSLCPHSNFPHERLLDFLNWFTARVLGWSLYFITLPL